jgi:hypothetical protein
LRTILPVLIIALFSGNWAYSHQHLFDAGHNCLTDGGSDSVFCIDLNGHGSVGVGDVVCPTGVLYKAGLRPGVG